jgi:hypothetical protein
MVAYWKVRTMREYLRVTPTSEGLDPEGIPRVLESLHKLTTAESTGFAQKLNPLHSDTPLRFEFLALSEGTDDPVEFFYGADEHLDILEKRLRSIYLGTFDIERIDVDITFTESLQCRFKLRGVSEQRPNLSGVHWALLISGGE